ncbi:MAG: molybdopterin-guanine dinucleotide biosynthesis protein B [Anaerolineae bacterium]
MPVSSSESRPTIPVVAFVGRSGSGKTTLLERLLPKLNERGVRVAVVKHAVRHTVASDVPGTDTYRFWQVGAAQVALVARDRLAWTKRYDREPELGEVLAQIEGVDLILLEGYKASAFPKVEVVRRACDPELLSGIDNVVGVVTDVPDLAGVAADVPLFPLDGSERLVGFLIQRFVARKGG